jgi:hypothetical protein
MSLAIALETVMPGALYTGSLTADTPEAYAAIQWLDTRPKPPYEKVAAAVPDVKKDVLKAYAAKLRYKRQKGGYTFRGKQYNADVNAITALTAAFALAKANNSYNTQWKLADGTFIPMNAANVTGVYNAITGFIQALFTAEAVVSAAIDAGSVTNQTQVISVINTVPNSS